MQQHPTGCLAVPCAAAHHHAWRPSTTPISLKLGSQVRILMPHIITECKPGNRLSHWAAALHTGAESTSEMLSETPGISGRIVPPSSKNNAAISYQISHREQLLPFLRKPWHASIRWVHPGLHSYSRAGQYHQCSNTAKRCGCGIYCSSWHTSTVQIRHRLL